MNWFPIFYANQVFWPALFVSAILSYPIYRLLILTKSRQTIDPHAPETHQRKQGTPTMGGLIIVVAFAFGMWALNVEMPTARIDYGHYEMLDLRATMMVAFFGYALIGFIDDFLVPKFTCKRGLGWSIKLTMQIAIGVLAVYLLPSPESLVFQGIALFLILFFSNAFNFADGLDGLSGSLVLAMGFGAILLNLLSGSLMVAASSASLMAGAIIFLFYNAPPAKVFMGDVASLPIGAVFGLNCALLMIPGSPEIVYSTPPALSAVAPIVVFSLVMVAELVPVPMQVAYYKLTKKRLFPMTPIHHAFEKKGWPETRIVFYFALTQLLLSIGAFSLALYLLRNRP